LVFYRVGLPVWDRENFWITLGFPLVPGSLVGPGQGPGALGGPVPRAGPWPRGGRISLGPEGLTFSPIRGPRGGPRRGPFKGLGLRNPGGATRGALSERGRYWGLWAVGVPWGPWPGKTLGPLFCGRGPFPRGAPVPFGGRLPGGPKNLWAQAAGKKFSPKGALARKFAALVFGASPLFFWEDNFWGGDFWRPFAAWVPPIFCPPTSLLWVLFYKKRRPF